MKAESTERNPTPAKSPKRRRSFESREQRDLERFSADSN